MQRIFVLWVSRTVHQPGSPLHSTGDLGDTGQTNQSTSPFDQRAHWHTGGPEDKAAAKWRAGFEFTKRLSVPWETIGDIKWELSRVYWRVRSVWLPCATDTCSCAGKVSSYLIDEDPGSKLAKNNQQSYRLLTCKFSYATLRDRNADSFKRSSHRVSSAMADVDTLTVLLVRFYCLHYVILGV